MDSVNILNILLEDLDYYLEESQSFEEIKNVISTLSMKNVDDKVQKIKDVNCQDQLGNTVFHLVLEVIKSNQTLQLLALDAFLQKGAKKLGQPNHEGKTPLILAVENDLDRVIEWMCQKDPSLIHCSSSTNLMEFAMGNLAFLSMIALYEINQDLINQPMKKLSEGSSLLNFCLTLMTERDIDFLQGNVNEDFQVILQFLLENSSEEILCSRSHFGSVLHPLIKCNNFSGIQSVLKRSVPEILNIKDCCQKTPLFYALENPAGNYKAAQILLEEGNANPIPMLGVPFPSGTMFYSTFEWFVLCNRKRRAFENSFYILENLLQKTHYSLFKHATNVIFNNYSLNFDQFLVIARVAEEKGINMTEIVNEYCVKCTQEFETFIHEPWRFGPYDSIGPMGKLGSWSDKVTKSTVPCQKKTKAAKRRERRLKLAEFTRIQHVPLVPREDFDVLISSKLWAAIG